MRFIGFIVYLVVGILQVAAIIAGLELWIGIHWVIAVPIALFTAYFPIVGTIFGFAGAVMVWHWAWWQAGLLYFGGLLFVIFAGGLSFALEKLRR